MDIASLPMTDIPAALRLDVSPPLYYFILHIWTQVFGTSELATHTLSAVFASAALIMALLLGRLLGGAPLGALLPLAIASMPRFLYNSAETRMYSLTVLELIILIWLFFRVFIHRQRRLVPLFGVAAAALMLTHNWGLVAALAVYLGIMFRAVTERDEALRRDLMGALLISSLLYMPWLPFLLGQVQADPVPWLDPAGPGGDALVLLRSFATPVHLLVLPASLLGGLLIARLHPPLGHESSWPTCRVPGHGSLLFGYLAALTCTWITSQLQPIWFERYLFVVVPIGMVCLSIWLTRWKPTWLAALITVSIALLVQLPTGFPERHTGSWKSSAHVVATELRDMTAKGDVVVLPPNRLSVVRHYLGNDLLYVTPLGLVDSHRGIVDFRDRLTRMRDGVAIRQLADAVSGLPRGHRVVFLDDQLNISALPGQNAAMRQLRRILEFDPRLAPIGSSAWKYETSSFRGHITRRAEFEVFVKQ